MCVLPPFPSLPFPHLPFAALVGGENQKPNNVSWGSLRPVGFEPDVEALRLILQRSTERVGSDFGGEELFDFSN